MYKLSNKFFCGAKEHCTKLKKIMLKDNQAFSTALSVHERLS